MTTANSSAREGTDPTPRELEVLRAWAEYGTARDAAASLGITEGGVEKLLANVRARAGVRRTVLAVRRYLS